MSASKLDGSQSSHDTHGRLASAIIPVTTLTIDGDELTGVSIQTGHNPLVAHRANAGLNPLDDAHRERETHTTIGVVNSSPSHVTFDTQSDNAAEAILDDSHSDSDIHRNGAVVNSFPGHIWRDTQSGTAGETLFNTDQAVHETQTVVVGVGPSYEQQAIDGTLLLACKTVDELEELRKATDNRLRQLTRNEPDKDGEIRGAGLDERHPHVANAAHTAELIRQAEKSAIKDLEKVMREHHLYAFIKDTKGLGAKTVARLLAEIGDPWWHSAEQRPRTVSELWAYCGLAVHAGHAQRRRKGEQANWSDEAKKRVWIIAQQPIKNGGKYRDVYDLARSKYAEALHPHDCVRCGPAGKPALAGTPLSDGHKHARAVRLMCKEILKDLWIASRDYHLNGADRG